jgi:prevent-host-death family protein
LAAPPRSGDLGSRDLSVGLVSATELDELGASTYVQHVRDGGEVVVTMRGRRVARLLGVDEVDAPAELRARGLVREPTAPRGPRARRARLKAAGPVSDLVADQRR